MNETKVTELLDQLQNGRLTQPQKDAIRLSLKQAAVEIMRRNQPLPLPLGWYLGLMLEDPKPKENSFLQVRDSSNFPKNRTKGTFAVAWSYDYLSRLSARQRRKDFDGEDDIEVILEEHFDIAQRHVTDATNTYSELVHLLNERAFTPETINPYFARYAISFTYIDDGIKANDVWFEAILLDGTLLQCLRDGNFRAFTPTKTRQVERMRFDSSKEFPLKEQQKNRPITHR